MGQRRGLALVTRRVPWWLKLGLKAALGAARVPYRCSHRLRIGRHGPMTDTSYALAVARHHLRAVEAPASGFTALELGPGDSLLGAYFAAAAGATEAWLVDTAAFASYSPSQVEGAANLLRSEGMPVPELLAPPTIESFLEEVHGHYLTDGLTSLRSIPDDSVDIVWSHAVLEHVRRHELAEVVGELVRVLRPGGRMSHVVDFEDHLSAGFNNLRFASRTWERPLIWNSGCYTNRFSLSELLAGMEHAGLDVQVTDIKRRPVPDGLRRTLAPEFRCRSDEDLSAAAADLLATVRPAAPHPGDIAQRRVET